MSTTQALEGADIMLAGTLYSHLADSCMGLADPDATPASDDDDDASERPSTPDAGESPSSRSHHANIADAELYIDRARECFKKAEYLEGECEQLMKKAIIAKLRGDEKVAEEWAMKHNTVWEKGFRAQEA
jgi:anaphase-promoting complex subunit 5